MKKRFHKERKATATLSKGFIGGLFSVMSTIIFALVFAALMEKGLLSTKLMGAAGYTIIGLSALSGGMMSGLTVRENRLANVMMSGAVYFSLLFLGKVILKQAGAGRILPSLAIILGTDLLAALIITSAKKRKF